MARPITVLDATEDIACLRFMAHMEEGDQVILAGCPDDGMVGLAWWPQVAARVHDILAEREGDDG